MTGQAAVLGAKDGGGKGAIATMIVLSFVTGLPLLQEKVWVKGPVAIITYEDDQTEWQRRIAAACKFHTLNYNEVLDDIHFLVLPDRKIVLAAIQDGCTVFPDGSEIVAALRAIGAVAVIIDPLNHAHDMGDGNNNVLIAQVAGEITRVARDSETAGLVLHHLRKGGGGDMDDLMGATSLRATFRSARILARMDEKTAEGLKIDEEWRYIRVVGSKENYAPPPDKATWYKLNSVPLGNVTERYPQGDNVAAASKWSPPSPFEGVAWEDILAVLGAIDSGMTDGERYSAARQAKRRWAGQLLTERGRTAEQAMTVLATWLSESLLLETEYDSPGERKRAKGLFVDAPKLAAMRASAAPADDHNFDG